MKAEIKSEQKFNPIVMEIVLESEQDCWDLLAIFNQSIYQWRDCSIPGHPVSKKDVPSDLFMVLDNEIKQRRI